MYCSSSRVWGNWWKLTPSHLFSLKNITTQRFPRFRFLCFTSCCFLSTRLRVIQFWITWAWTYISERIREDASILWVSRLRQNDRQNDRQNERWGTKLRESMRPLWFFHLYILSSATTALSTLCQGRLYPHLYIYVFFFKVQFVNWETLYHVICLLFPWLEFVADSVPFFLPEQYVLNGGS